jgi:hypothetical protein
VVLIVCSSGHLCERTDRVNLKQSMVVLCLSDAEEFLRLYTLH